MQRWYVLYTKPRQEFQLNERLRQADFSTFLPVNPLRSKAKRQVRRALFPRYLFIRLDLSQVSPDSVRWTPGLIDFVKFAGEYAIVDDRVIDYIRDRLNRFRGRQKAPFVPGQKVRVVGDHPLAMLDAVFEEPLSDAKRGYILLEVLGRITRCEISLDNLEAVELAKLDLAPSS